MGRALLTVILGLSLMACGAKKDAEAPSADAPKSAESEKATDSQVPPSAKGDEAAALVGSPAPDFKLKDTEGNEHTLSEHNGKSVVLEGYNPDCPFVVHAHSKGSLVQLAQLHSEGGVVWFAINSGGEGKQGHGLERNEASREEYGFGHPVLLDPDGKVGRAYGAKTPPQMYVVDKDGILRYAGAIDNVPMGRMEGDKPREFVTAAITDLQQSRKVEISQTVPYGCSVKYAD